MPDPAPLELIYRREAEQDLDALYDFVALDRPQAAERFLLEIRRACEGLRLFPYVGVQIDRADERIRMISVRRRVAVQYAVLGRRVHILAVSYRGIDLRRVLEQRRP